MKKSQNYLIDVNVWVALTVGNHQHAAVAKNFFLSGKMERGYFCRSTQQGLFRLLSNRVAMSGYPLAMVRCWEIYGELMSDARIGFLNEPDGLEAVWRERTSLRTISPKLWMDAYLQAFAQLADVKILTFDRALAQAADGEWLEV